MSKRIVEISLLIFMSVVCIILFEFSLNKSYATEGSEKDIPEYTPAIEYGIVVDSMLIHSGTIKRNQFLSDILLAHGADYALIDQAARNAMPVFDVRRIKAGQHYSVLKTNDSTGKLQYFVYEDTPSSYIVFDLRDSVHVHTGKKQIHTKTNTLTGTIHSSLWNSIIEQDADPNLANELSEIFAWTIDFFGIQKGDSYKIIFEELYVDDQKIGLGKVQAALFNHLNENYYAFYFVQDSMGDYFDEKAQSLCRTFLKAPLRFKRISSRYSGNRLHPVLKIRRPHYGVDYAAAVGTPVLAIGDGVVTKFKHTRQGGRELQIKHNGTYSSAYLHLSGYAKGIKKGMQVKQGQVIAYVGKTGLASGPHLDFRFYRNGKPVDPLKVKSAAVKPIDSAHYPQFQAVRELYIAMLDSIK